MTARYGRTPMRLISLLAGSALASTLLLGPAAAGLLDSPPPDRGAGATPLVVYRMGPVHYEPGGWVDTTVTCTNLAGATTRMAFEVFDEQDHVVGQVPKVDVAGNASVTFATSADANVPGAVVVASLPPIDHGK